MEQEIQRLIEKLHTLEPGTEEYRGILTDLDLLIRTRSYLKFDLEFFTPGERSVCNSTKPEPRVLEKVLEAENQGGTVSLEEIVPIEAAPTDEDLTKGEPAVEEAAPEETPAEAPKKTRGKKTETEQPKLEAAFVRGELAKARRKGVNVTEIVTSFGVDNFKDIPAERYPEILEKLKEVS